MCHFGGPVKGIMQEVEGFDGRFIKCLGWSLRGRGGVGAGRRGGGGGGGTAVDKLQKEGFNYDTDPLEFLVCRVSLRGRFGLRV
jgi:hypothetical protein